MSSKAEILRRLTASGRFELVPDTSLGYPIRIYKNGPTCLRDLFLSTAAYSDRTYIVFGREELSYAAVHQRVSALASFLADHGVQKGDRVALGMRNYPEWIVSFWACQLIGAVAVALNAWWTASELAYAISDSAPTAFLLDSERLERAGPLLKDQSTVVVASRGGGRTKGFEDFETIVAAVGKTPPQVEIRGTDLASILYTSGTTGNPKGAVGTQQNHITCLNNALLGGTVAQVLAGLPEDFVGPQPGVLQTFPLFHIAGMSGLYVATAMGAKIVLMNKWNAAEAVRLIAEHQLTAVGAVPFVMRELLNEAVANGQAMSSLVNLGVGGAPVPSDLIRQIGEQFKARTTASNGYGLTETTGSVVTNRGPEYISSPDSVGRPVPTAEVRFVDAEGQDTPFYEVGELWVRGPNVSPGYWNNKQATVAAFGGGWFRTGDLGYRDKDGLIYVVDRIKDVIIRGGENVYCAEVESAIVANPSVRDAAVVGICSPTYGEEVAAVVQIDDVSQSEEIEPRLRIWLAERLARFKMPNTIVFTASELPRNATGKILKRDIRTRFFGQ